MSQGRCALHGHIAGPVQGWGMAHCHPLKPWSAVPASSALCGSVNSEVVFMAAGLWGGAGRLKTLKIDLYRWKACRSWSWSVCSGCV